MSSVSELLHGRQKVSNYCSKKMKVAQTTKPALRYLVINVHVPLFVPDCVGDVMKYNNCIANEQTINRPTW
jgi:hypothetical protein